MGIKAREVAPFFYTMESSGVRIIQNTSNNQVFRSGVKRGLGFRGECISGRIQQDSADSPSGIFFRLRSTADRLAHDALIYTDQEIRSRPETL
jgi:hypothetical protein